MPRMYTVSVEVIRAYVVEVEASTAGEAMQKVENMTPEQIDTDGEYIDTHVIPDEPELKETT